MQSWAELWQWHLWGVQTKDSKQDETIKIDLFLIVRWSRAENITHSNSIEFGTLCKT